MTDLTANTATLAATLTGAERLIGEQGGDDVVVTPDQIKAFVLQGVPMVGVRLAVTSTQLQTLLDALPADQVSEVHVRWTSGARMRTGDALYTFVKTTLGFTDPDMAALMANAATFD